MLNYITFYIGDFLLKTYMKDPKSTHVASLKFAKTARLFEFTRGIHLGLVIAVILVVAAWLFLYHTKWGYAIRMCGENKICKVFGNWSDRDDTAVSDYRRGSGRSGRSGIYDGISAAF